MIRIVIALVTLCAACLATAPVRAADWVAPAAGPPTATRPAAPPYWVYRPPAPSRRSEAVLASEACWRTCTAQCGGQFQACLRVVRIEDCTAQNNACDRFCLKDCRLAGGPLLNWTE